MTRASVLIPTHDAASTLDLAVGSALAQTVEDLEVVVIGDGVTPEVRDLARGLARADGRVRFLDLPKGEHHGERHRDLAVRECTSAVVCYLCDDDLLLPDHVASMLALLEQADLANSLNGQLGVDGEFNPHWSDLASAEHRRWLAHPHHNSVSVTGTAHTVACYRRLDVGWAPPPSGRWTDHMMWQKFLALPGLRAVTSDSVTALQFPTHLEGRQGWSAAERRAELQRWWDLINEPGGRSELDAIVRRGMNRHGARLQQALTEDLDRLAGVRRQLADAQRAGAELHARCEALRQTHAATAKQLALVTGSRTWRLREAVVRGPLRRLVRR